MLGLIKSLCLASVVFSKVKHQGRHNAEHGRLYCAAKLDWSTWPQPFMNPDQGLLSIYPQQKQNWSSRPCLLRGQWRQVWYLQEQKCVIECRCHCLPEMVCLDGNSRPAKDPCKSVHFNPNHNLYLALTKLMSKPPALFRLGLVWP